MAFQHHDYDLLTILDAEAIGQPGQRRFRLIAGIESDVVSLWMEKEQLQALGLAIEQLIDQLTTAGLAAAAVEPEHATLEGPVPPNAPEYQVSKMAIGFDDERNLVAFFAHDIEQDEDDAAIFSGRAPLSVATALAAQISEVVAAGRPRCPRCGAPIGPEGHVCPHNNGHLPWTVE